MSADTRYTDPVLPTDSEERKKIPIFSGLLNYFPLALAAVARLSKFGNDKHNPGQPLHWSRDKSNDHLDCVGRHLIDFETLNACGEYQDAAECGWRGLAKLQELEEKRLGKAVSRGSRVDEVTIVDALRKLVLPLHPVRENKWPQGWFTAPSGVSLGCCKCFEIIQPGADIYGTGKTGAVYCKEHVPDFDPNPFCGAV